jgi:hypothetical protein
MKELAEPLRSRLQTMMGDAPNHGLTLVSGFRDPGRQWDLRHERCRGRECDRGCRGFPLTALPGASNHQRRTAADIGGWELAWANRVKASYGLATPVRGEPWHFEAAGNPTKPIRPFAAVASTSSGVMKEDDRGDNVKFLQHMLNICQRFHKGKLLEPDGVFGSDTKEVVEKFQAFARAMQQLAGQTDEKELIDVDGKVGSQTLSAIPFWVAAALEDE